MKIMLKKIALIALAALMVVSLVSCDKSNAVKKAFEKAYNEVELKQYDKMKRYSENVESFYGKKPYTK